VSLYSERTARAFGEILATLQDDSNFADGYTAGHFEAMALDNARELAQIASESPGPDRMERRLDAARRLAAVAVHLMVCR
jgi:hypothetical protein